jgi:hypothetical protein
MIEQLRTPGLRQGIARELHKQIAIAAEPEPREPAFVYWAAPFLEEILVAQTAHFG